MRVNLDTKDSSFVSDEILWLPMILGDTLYYMNLDDKERSIEADSRVSVGVWKDENGKIK